MTIYQERSSSNTGEFECLAGSLWNRTGCVLTYGGSATDIILNYVVFLVNLVYCIAAVRHYSATNEAARSFRRFALMSLIGVMAFQLVLCLILGCSGISIVWCAMGGWSMNERRAVIERQGGSIGASLTSLAAARLRGWGTLVILLDLAIILYYAVVAEAITTVAHICALILGATLSRASLQQYPGDQTANTDSEPLLTGS